MSFGCECSCLSHRRVSNFISKVPQGVSTLIYNLKEIGGIFVELVLMSSRSTGGDAKTIISPNTSFGDIMSDGILIIHCL